MAFSMSGMSSGFSSGTANQNATITESDGVISEITTKALAFKALAKTEIKARVFPQPWPEDALPPAYASLLAISSAQGLFVAGAPDALIIGRTADVRKTFYDQEGQNIRDVKAINTISHNRPTLVAFAADESCLVVAEEQAGGFTAYQTTDLTTPSPRVGLQQSTNAPVKAFAPNPVPAQAHSLAVLNTKGELLLADLKTGQLVTGEKGPVLAENVSCVTWSNKGKQLMAGRTDGSAVQLKPDGSIVATVGRPPSVAADCLVTQIVWLENEVYMFSYTSASPDKEDSVSCETFSFLVRTDKARSEFTFHKFDYEPLFPEIARGPTHFHTARLRNYAPDLSELLIMGASTTTEIKMLTKASKPLEDGANIDTYTATMSEEGLQANVPMLGADQVSPIGLAVDLSDDGPITSPLHFDQEVESSDIPLPELVTLGDNGLIAIWAIVYEDAVRSKIPYPGFAEIKTLRDDLAFIGQETLQATPVAAPAPPTNQPDTQSPFTSSPFKSSTMSSSNPQSTIFNQPAVSKAAAFGQSTPIGGETKSSWTSTGFGTGSGSSGATFGQAPSFGATPALGSNTKPTFGQSATPSGGAAFGQPGLGQKPAFGQTGFGQPAFGAQSNQASPFSATGSKPGGFSAFAGSGGGFATANKDTSSSSGFAKFGSGGGFGDAKASSPFAAKPSSSTATFGQPTAPSTFGQPSLFGAPAAASSPFSQAGKSAFTLESTFQRDETSKDDSEFKKDSGAGFSFGGLGGMLGSTTNKAPESPTKELDMGEDDDGDDQSSMEEEVVQSVRETPPSTISQLKTTPTPHVHSLFGQASTTPQTEPQSKAGSGFNFGSFPSTTPKDGPGFMWGTNPVSKETPAAVQKSEPTATFSFKSLGQSKDVDKGKSGSDEDEVKPTKIPAAPLPPDPFSKPGFQTGDTSVSSLNSKESKETEEPPLPPDFLPANKSASESLKQQDSEVPSEFLSSEFDEDSGEDINEDVSPTEDKESDQEEPVENVETSPESSFGRVSDHSPVASPTGGPFTKISKIEQPKTGRPLFGELGQTGPILPPPQPKPQESPRSPSPMRKPSRQTLLARSPERSFSAPARPRSILEQRKSEFKQSPFATQAAKVREQEIEQERARNEAARKAREDAAAAEVEPLIDDEDLILQEELAKPTKPSENLDPYITIQPGKIMADMDKGRTDIPSQIEKLYQDVNSMVVTLGINVKSLRAFMMYQAGQEPSQHWPAVLSSDTPIDALNEDWYLGDTDSLPKGVLTLEADLKSLEIKDVAKKLNDCQELLTREVTDLRGRITTLRRSTQAQSQPENNLHAPLSAEQASIQQDLRKSSASVLSSLNGVEENLAVLKARLADIAPSESASDKQGVFGFGSSAPRKPTVEAVMTTVAKLTSMAEKKSADIDVLEAQMRKLKLPINEKQPTTPERRNAKGTPSTPGSATSSVFYTPGSKGSRSVRTTPSRNQQPLVSTEDKQKWQNKVKRRKDVADTLRAVLQEKHNR